MPLAGHGTSPAVQGLPTGGAAGQVLAKQSGNDYDLTWSTPAQLGTGMHAPMVSGLWFCHQPIALATTTSSTYGVQNPSVYYLPFWLDVQIKIVGLGFYSVSNSGSPTATLGLSTVNASTGMPGTVIGYTSVAMGTTTGATTATVSYTAPQGWNYLIIGCSAGTQFNAMGLANNGSTYNRTPLGSAAAGGGTASYLYTTSTGIPVSNPTGLTADTSYSPPLMWFKVG